MASDLLSTIRAEIAERMDRLRPLLDEHERLLVAAEALEVTRVQGSRSDVAANGATAQRSARPGRARAAAPVAAETTADGGQDGSAAETVAETAPRLARWRPRKSSPPVQTVRGVARETILAALEHGSHTVGELAVVTAMSAPNINGSLRRLVSEGVVVKTEREGKTAWSLAELVA